MRWTYKLAIALLIAGPYIAGLMIWHDSPSCAADYRLNTSVKTTGMLDP